MKINWSRESSLGLIIGIISPLVFLPIVLLVLSQAFDSNFSYFWDQVVCFPEFRSKYLSLALISNLLWFYLFLNKGKYEYTKGIILGLLCYTPYMIYVNIIM